MKLTEATLRLGYTQLGHSVVCFLHITEGTNKEMLFVGFTEDGKWHDKPAKEEDAC
jgi:hypothetical protein